MVVLLPILAQARPLSHMLALIVFALLSPFSNECKRFIYSQVNIELSTPPRVYVCVGGGVQTKTIGSFDRCTAPGSKD